MKVALYERRNRYRFCFRQGSSGCQDTYIEIDMGDVFRVTWGGYGYGYPATFYVVADGKVYVADQPEVEDLYESLGIEMPFNLTFDEDRLVITANEWKTV